ncbi:GNAT family N-acetyltransferase [Hydrogenophaga defluvii]|uniref:GNAT family N-acetyltransferase n=1 Tax=Hydrogenophaga defluvii TaxID=249410 RepID=A0ABW2S861_9BURK
MNPNHAAPAFELSHVNAAEGAERLVVLFETVFQHAVSPQDWAWKYAHAASFHTIACAPDGSLLGHAGMQFAGHLPNGRKAGQVCDVMVHPAHRGQLQGGVFARMLGELAAEAGRRDYGLCYGFPGDRPAKLGVRLGVYDEVARPREAVFRPQAASLWERVWWVVHELDTATFARRLDAEAAARVVVRRTAEQVLWRYVQAPRVYRYFVVGPRWRAATLVVKDGGDGTLLVVDALGAARCTSACLQALANVSRHTVRGWAHLVTGAQGEAEPTPLVTIELAQLPGRSRPDNWFDDGRPGDVDIY